MPKWHSKWESLQTKSTLSTKELFRFSHVKKDQKPSRQKLAVIQSKLENWMKIF